MIVPLVWKRRKHFKPLFEKIKEHHDLDYIPLEQRAHFYTLLMGVCALCEADSPDSQMSGLFCVALLRTRECLPCAAIAAIPAHLQRKQSADADHSHRKA